MSKPKFFLVVAGGRDFTDFDRMKREVCDLMWNQLKDFQVVIVQGECPTGADYLAKITAQALNLTCVPCPADWAAHGRAAGPIRNSTMAEYGNGLLAFATLEDVQTAALVKAFRDLGKVVHLKVC